MKITKLFGITLAFLCVGALASCNNDGGKTSAPTTVPTSTPTVAPTSTPTTTAPVSDVLTYAEYVAAENGTEVTIAAYIQAKQSWWKNQAVVYLQDDNGGYFVYNLPCTEEQYNTDLAIGNRVKITGIKGAWAGQVEILGSEAGAEATYELLAGNKVYEAKAMTVFDSESLLAVLNQKVSFENLEVVSVTAPTQDGGDIYFDVTNGEYTYTFCIESYLTSKSTEVYQTALALKAGDVINCEGFMYCYNNPQLHTTAITVKTK